MLMEHENCPCMETCPLNRAMALILSLIHI